MAEHNRRVGALIGNLQSLEFLLRWFLYLNQEASTSIRLLFGQSLQTLSQGDEVCENAVTNYDTLRILIEKYNKAVHGGPDLVIDPSIVDLRDALAHGRISAPIDSGVLRLLKFAKPRRGTVKVVYSQPLTSEWLAEQTERILLAINSVGHALGPRAEFIPAAD